MSINFTKYADGLVPAIVQDANTKTVLMLGFMNQAAVDATLAEGKVTFYSRSKNRLWTKGEESGNFLNYISMKEDCDQDTLLIQASPEGPVCHMGTDTCWGEDNNEQLFLDESADLLFHYLILLQSKGYQLADVVKVLSQRHKP